MTTIPGWPLAIFRIAFGLLYLDMAFQKAPWKQYGWLAGFIQKEIEHPAFAFVAVFLRDTVLPNLGLFGMMTFVTELALGIGLLTGTLTRLVALVGFLWQVNIAIQAFNVPGEWYWIWPLLTLPQFTFAASGAGRVAGVDGMLRRSLEKPTDSAWQRLVRLAT
jgi:thiosulfate dehydrogenase [quinone] large subunit